MTRAFVLFLILTIVHSGQSDRKSSLTFVIDVTNSMETVRMQVERNAHSIFDAVFESDEPYIEDFVLVTFADPDKYATSVINVTKTKNRDEFKDAFVLTLVSGGRCPEYSLSGIQAGIENSSPGSSMYIFTDASAKDYKKYDYVRNIAQDKEIQMIFILTGKCDLRKFGRKGYDVYWDLASDTSGQVFNLGKNDVVEILKYIKDSIIARRILLYVKSFPAGIGHTFNYTVDHATRDTTIAISCTNPSLNIKGPDSGIVQVKNLVKLENISVVKVNESKIGIQTVTINCTSDTRVVATARSDIRFHHGFSGFEPVSLNDTTTKPSPDGSTHLLIQIEGNFLPHTVDLLDESDKAIPGYTKMPLTAINDTYKLFLAGPFEPPFITFRILTPILYSSGNTDNGREFHIFEVRIKNVGYSSYLPEEKVALVTGENLDHNETITRIGTLIEPQNPYLEKRMNTKPTISIENSPNITVELDSPLRLKCTVNAYPKPNITWERNGIILETNVYDVRLPYNYVSVHKIDKVTENATYECKASNTLGPGEDKSINVYVEQKKYFNVLESPKDITYEVAYSTTVKFDCKADAYPPAEVNWYKNGNILLKDDLSVSSDGFTLTIKHMQPIDAGKILCEVKNIHHTKTYPFKVQITGMVKPKISSISSTMYIPEMSSTLISCRIKDGIPKPIIEWYYKGTVSDTFVEIKEAKDQEDLSLTNILRKNNGTYKCVATNVMGSDTMEANLIVEYAPTMDNDSKPTTVKTDEEITLTCSADGVPEPVVVWSKDDAPLTGSKFVSSSDHRLIFKADLDDSGAYQCFASNKLGTDNKTIIVEVEKSPTVLIKESDPFDAEYDAPLNITCEVLGYPKPDIVWININSGAKLDADVEEKSPYKFVSYLNIEKITTNDTYQCKANNRLGNSEKKIAVKTEIKPYFNVLERPKDITYDVAYGTTVKFDCKADAYPPAEVNWYKNGNILLKDDLSVSSDGFTLTIQHMQPIDAGKFMCEVKNIHHTKTYPFKVQITGVAKPKIGASVNMQYVLENSITKINCRVEEGIPKPSIQWYYKDKVTNMFTEIKVAKDQEDLFLTNIKREEQGTYKCVATNVVGSVAEEYKIVVQYAPTIVNSSETMTALAGTSVLLKCSADGLPLPKVEWTKEEKTLPNLKYETSANHDLKFIVNLDDRGIYKCNASNELGMAIKTVNIEVENAPTVAIVGDHKQQVYVGDTLQLKCNVIGNPAPAIQWRDTTNDIVLSGSVSTVKYPYEYFSILSIDKTNKNASYQCEATNKHGVDKASVVVQAVMKKHFYVTEKPKDTTIEFTTEGKLYCKVDAYPPAKITWYKDSNRLTSKDGIKISNDGSTLSFENMQPNQEGTYFCVASNTDTTKTSIAKVTISGVELPMILKRPEENHMRVYLVKEGDSIRLLCKIAKGTPKPTIKWLIKNKLTNKFTEIVDAKNKEDLLISNVLRDQNAMYACEADNIVGSDSLKMDLQVEYRPIIRNDKTVYGVKEGDEINIPCVVNGNPKPTAKWTKHRSSASFASTTDHSFRLITNLGDSGTYTCSATNKHGVDSRTVRLNVYAISIRNKDSKQIVEEHDTLELHCKAVGRPKPTIEWLYEGTIEEPKSPPVMLLRGYRDLEIDDIRFDQRGRYTCVASNNLGGRATFTFNVDVYTAIKIHNKDRIVRSVDGDKVLGIYCNATGNPKPYYKWFINKALAREVGDTLFLRNVNRKHNASEVLCEAINDNDLDHFVFTVIIDDYPTLNNPNSTFKIESGASALLACPIPHRKGGFLRWYKDKTKIHEGELFINNAKASNAGLYTCRVSDLAKSESANVHLIVGTKLKFMNMVVQTTLSLGFGELANLDCVAIGNPTPRVSWTYNGNIVSRKVFYRFNMDQAKVGQYKCEATNDYDTISRTFDVILSQCLLKIDPSANKQPLILTPYFTWPSYKYDIGFLYMPKYQNVLLACRNTSKLNIIDYDYVYAYCNSTGKTAELTVNEISYDYINIQCSEEVKPRAKWTGKPCFGADSEMVEIVYEVLHKTFRVYEICMDISNDIAFYSKQHLRMPLSDAVPKKVPWFNDRLKYDFDKFYDVDEQINGISATIRRWWHRYDRCVFSRRQLVNPLDVFPGLPQRATFTHLNVVPHWSTCSLGNWDDIESRVRKLAQSKDELIVWTGTSEALKLLDPFGKWVDIFISNKVDTSSQPVSTYLWKVVQNPKEKSSLVIIQLNIPDITFAEARNYVRCKDICHSIPWMNDRLWTDTSKGYVFCCSLRNFEQKFRYKGRKIFGTGMDNLLKS